jgi:allophanate hydrolase subunit 2
VLGRTSEGARSYLAVRGGWQTTPILGSRSWEVRLAAGTVVRAEPGTVPTRRIDGAAWKSPTAAPLRIILGPDPGLGSGFDKQFWISRQFRVSSHADRVGLRLVGEPVTVDSPPDRLSAPVAAGAIQVAGGQLIILGVACGTMGGYPHIAHVISADFDCVGQLKPDDSVKFLPVSLTDARRIDQESRAQTKMLIDRLRLIARDEETH